MDTTVRVPSGGTSATPMPIALVMTATTQNQTATGGRSTVCRIGRKDIGMGSVGQCIGRIATMPGVPRRIPSITATLAIGARLAITADTGRPIV